MEDAIITIPKGMKPSKHSKTVESISLKDAPQSITYKRFITDIQEFDRVCGGGLVPGSVILVGGDPGIGKSTLLLQVASALSRKHACFYISGEEGTDQICLRAHRLGVTNSPVQLSANNDLRSIIGTLESKECPQFAVIDSIQTIYLDSLDAAPGTVTQVRTCAQELIRVAKKKNLVLILVGHVTKEGTLAGPRVLEHMVDTVLYFEGDRGHQFRILRSVKNRFGASDEIGVFEMTQQGLMEVTNPSAAFIADRQEHVSGSVVFAGIEGTRPLLVEIQALAASSPFAAPRRNVIGWDTGRLAMIMAVLEARCGINFAGKDVFLNVAGGLKISEPAADLAVALALLSSLSGHPIPADHVVFGEIGLSGEIRTVGQISNRLKEAEKLGFKGAIVPCAKKQDIRKTSQFTIHELKGITEIMSLAGLDTGVKELLQSVRI